jgi:hypothetical protein
VKKDSVPNGAFPPALMHAASRTRSAGMIRVSAGLVDRVIAFLAGTAMPFPK